MKITNSITAKFRMPLGLAKGTLVAFLLVTACNLPAAVPADAPLLASLDSELFETAAQIQGMPDDENLQANLVPLISNLSRTLESSSNRDFRAHFLLSLIYARLGMEDLSKSELDLAQKNGGDKFNQLALQGLDHCVLNSDFAGAAVYFPFAEQAFPDAASVAVYKAIQLHRQGKFKEEENVLQSVLSKGSKSPELLTALAALRAEEGEYAQSIELFDRALNELPEYKPAWLGKARVLFNKKHYLEAAAICTPLYLSDFTQFELSDLIADSYCHIERYWESYQPALVSLAVAKRESDMKKAKRRIRFLWRMLSDDQKNKGLSAVSRRLDRTVFGPRFHFALADALQKEGFLDEAVRQFKQGLMLEPQHASAYKHLAEIYLNHYHKKITAIGFYRNYLDLIGSDPLLEKKLARLLAELKRKGDLALRFKNQMRSLPHTFLKVEKASGTDKSSRK